jgi:hypothetical protein
MSSTHGHLLLDFIWQVISGPACITQEGEIIKNLNKGEFYKYLGINQSNHIQHSIIKENLEKQFYLKRMVEHLFGM